MPRPKRNQKRKKSTPISKQSKQVIQEPQSIDFYTLSPYEQHIVMRDIRVEQGIANSSDLMSYQMDKLQQMEQARMWEAAQLKEVPTLGAKRLKDFALLFEAMRKSGIVEQSTTTRQGANSVEWGNKEIDKEDNLSRTIRSIADEGFPKGLSQNIILLIKELLKYADANNKEELQSIIEQCKDAIFNKYKHLQ